MFKRLARGGRYALIILRALPDPARRRVLWRMIAFSRELPGRFERPLPEMMAALTPVPRRPAPTGGAPTPDQIRQLADAVAAWRRRSPLGICLRRSLLRYYFLREVGLPVQIVFGARLTGGPAARGLGGHAWLTLNGRPYHERPGDYEGFAVMYRYPVDSGQ